MNVVSLFNGMGTLRQAFHDMNIKVDKYYSSEIKSHAIRLQQHHFPDVIQVGNILKWKSWDIEWKSIDFIGSGSPCQDLSIAGQGAGIYGKDSILFFTFVEILNHVKKLNPNVKYIQENVASAKKLDIGIMSRKLGVYPVKINSSLLTAQLRDRYYWTNISIDDNLFDKEVNIPQPVDLKIKLNDILTSGNSEKEKHSCLNRGVAKGGSEEYILRRSKQTGMLTIIYDNNKARVCNKIEMCRLQGFPDDYCDILSYNKAGDLLGDGWTLPVIIYLLTFLKAL